MEWVETTAKTLEAAREAALDRLGVGADEAEFDIVEEPKPGLFGRTRGQARIRARIRPATVRPKQERRRRSKSDKSRGREKGAASTESTEADGDVATADPDSTKQRDASVGRRGGSGNGERTKRNTSEQNNGRSRQGERTGNNHQAANKESRMSNDERPESTVTPQEVGDAAVSFMDDLVAAFGATGESELSVDGTELDVQVRGDDLGLLVGPGGRTLNAVQDLVRVAAQRRLGDHETRLRIDIAGYRQRRSAALAKFAAEVAQQVRDSGTARSLEPMTSADRKVIHDALNDEEGVESTSSGEDPNRRVVVQPL